MGRAQSRAATTATATRGSSVLTPEQRLRLRAVESLHYGHYHTKAPALADFGYLGLGLTAHHTERERAIVEEAIADLVVHHPADTRLVRTPEGKRLLVRPYKQGSTMEITDAFRLACTYARRAGV